MEKPKIGHPCNGCGICCRAQVCMNGAYVLGLVRHLGDTMPVPCPAMVIDDDGRVQCGIVLNPKKYIEGSKYPADVLSRNFAFLIGAGRGCDELGEEEDYEEEEKLAKLEETLTSDDEFKRKARIAVKVVHGIK